MSDHSGLAVEPLLGQELGGGVPYRYDFRVWFRDQAKLLLEQWKPPLVLRAYPNN